MGKIRRAQRFTELPEGRRYLGIVADLRAGALTDLTVAIIGGALADMVLAHVLEAYRVREAQPKKKRALSRIPDKLAKRIDLAAHLGIYGRWIHEDLHAIREIRNAAAHGVEVFDFDDASVSVHTSKMHFAGPRVGITGRPTPATSRERFVQSVELVTQLLLTDVSYRAHGFRTERLMHAGGPALLQVNGAQ